MGPQPGTSITKSTALHSLTRTINNVNPQSFNSICPGIYDHDTIQETHSITSRLQLAEMDSI